MKSSQIQQDLNGQYGADESGWPLLSPGCLHRQNPLLASASFSSAEPYESGCFVLAEES